MIRGVAFDLDGTLTRPFLNFKQIRLEMGVSLGRESLLDQIESMSEEDKSNALEVLARHEEAAVKNARLNHGVPELFDCIARLGLFSAVVTRNSDKSTHEVLDKLGCKFEKVITRDSAVPIKPDPASLLSLAREWGIETVEIMMVGDHIFDMQCGIAAGSVTCFVTNGNEVDNACSCDHTVSVPGDVILILEELLKNRD